MKYNVSLFISSVSCSILHPTRRPSIHPIHPIQSTYSLRCDMRLRQRYYFSHYLNQQHLGDAAPRRQLEEELREGAHWAGGDQEGPDRAQAPCGENLIILKYTIALRFWNFIILQKQKRERDYFCMFVFAGGRAGEFSFSKPVNEEPLGLRHPTAANVSRKWSPISKSVIISSSVYIHVLIHQYA